MGIDRRLLADLIEYVTLNLGKMLESVHLLRRAVVRPVENDLFTQRSFDPVDERPVETVPCRRIGHLRVDFSAEAPICDCGDRGHLSAVASGRAIYNHAARLAHSDPEAFACSSVGRTVSGDVSRLDNQLVARAFRAHDPWATELIGRVAEPLGRVLAGIHSAVGVERFVIIGGVAHALGPLYLGLVGQAAAQSQWSLGQCWEQMLELGVMGDDAGLIGAGRLAAR